MLVNTGETMVKTQMKRPFLIAWLFALIPIASFWNCKPDHFSGDSKGDLQFSTDTVTFDTVFTTIGSATLSFKVYNREKKSILINSISLAGGESSFFRLNIDGEPSRIVRNVEIPPDDSLYIFVAVTLDPTNTDNPLVIKDSIVFSLYGVTRDIKLIAYGQDVHLIDGKIITNETWTANKPYLIYNSMAVDTGCVLSIEAGTHIYFHRNSSMIVWGTLLVSGTEESPVVFQNDRLEENYDVIAGQWGTIYLDPISSGNRIGYAIIKNAIAGIQIGYPSDYHMPDLELSNSMIMNVSFAGIYAFGADITCYNTVISNCAGAAVAILRGGKYRFFQCTVSNNGVIGTARTDPSLILSNIFYSPEYDDASGQYVYVERTGDLEEATFANCIIYGNLNHEIQFSDNNINLFNYRIDHCLVKASEDSVDSGDTGHYPGIILNENPRFANDSDRFHLDYSLDTLSPAKDTGSLLIIDDFPFLENDITGHSRRFDGKPDLGAFERKED
jgi:hypothetical protein